MMSSLLNNSRRPDVVFHKDGTICINAWVAKSLALNAGDSVDVATSSYSNEFLLYVRTRAGGSIGRHEAQVYPTKKGKNHANNFRANSVRLCRLMMSLASPSNGECLKLQAGQPVFHGPNGVGIPLITTHPINTQS